MKRWRYWSMPVMLSAILGAITYRANRVTPTGIPAFLPKRPLVWSSWNYLLQDAGDQPPLLTYNMNIFCRIFTRPLRFASR